MAQGVQINLKSNIKDYQKHWKKLDKHIKPKHVGYAIGRTAFDLAGLLNRKTVRAFDSPNALTKKAFGYIAPTAQQKTIDEKSAWVGLKSERHIPVSKAKPKAKGFNSFKAQKTYRDLMMRQVYGGIRLPDGTPYLWTPSARSRAYGVMKKAGNLNYNKLKGFSVDKKKYFVGFPKHKQGQAGYRGLWKRLGKDGRDNIGKVANLSSQAVYKKKPFNFWGTLKISYPSLMKRNFDKEMVGLKRYLRKKRLTKMRNMKTG